MLHHGQGKWYPGEPLPRWAFALYWRNDGEPIWRDVGLLAQEPKGEDSTVGKTAATVDAAAFADRLADRMGLDPGSIQPAFEDPLQQVSQEGALPDNFDSAVVNTGDSAARKRLLQEFDASAVKPRAYVLPIRRWSTRTRKGWMTEIWRLRRGRMFLVPGDSPAGYRLPLSSLPELAEEDYPHVRARDPFEARGPLPPYAELAVAEATPGKPPAKEPPYVRTAITFEVREGLLHVFMPPVETAEDYLELTAQIEALAAEAGHPVRIEGYGAAGRPPHQRHQGHPRPRRAGGEHPPRQELGSGRQHHHRRL